MGKASNKHQRRLEIVQGLLSVMADKGYENASIKSIAEAAGLAPGLVHYHFKKKQDILIALIDWLDGRLQDQFLLALEKETSATSRLRAFIDVRLALGPSANRHVAAAWVVIGAEAVQKAEVGEAYRKVLAGQESELFGLLQAYAKEAALTVVDDKLRAVTASVMAQVIGLLQMAVVGDECMPTGYAAQTCFGMVEGLLAGHSAA